MRSLLFSVLAVVSLAIVSQVLGGGGTCPVETSAPQQISFGGDAVCTFASGAICQRKYVRPAYPTCGAPSVRVGVLCGAGTVMGNTYQVVGCNFVTETCSWGPPYPFPFTVANRTIDTCVDLL